MEMWLVSLASSLIGPVPCAFFIISFGYFIVQIQELSSLVKFHIHIDTQIEQYYAKETAQLNPPHRFVPWVVVNNQPLQEVGPFFFFDE